MRVYINNIPCDLLPGMTVRHALIQACLLKEREQSQKVYDEQGNEIVLGRNVLNKLRLLLDGSAEQSDIRP